MIRSGNKGFGPWSTAAMFVSVAMLAAACSGGDSEQGADVDDGVTSTIQSAPNESTSDWDAVVEAAGEEGEVVFYTSQTDQVIASIEEAFEAEYPEIDLVGLRTLGGELVTRVEQEQATNADGADVIVGSDPAFMRSVDESGGLLAIQSPMIEERASLFEAHPLLHPSDNRVIFSAEGYWLTWNTDLVEEPIVDYADFVERGDEFSGAFGIPDLFSPSVPIFYTHVAEGMDDIDMPQSLEDDGEIERSDYLEGIAELEPRFYESAVPLAQAVASGEIKAGWFSIASTIDTLKSEGAPIEAVLSEDAPTAASMTMGVTSWSKRTNAAQLLVDFLLSDDGQNAANSHMNLGLLDGIEGGAGGPDLMALPRDEVLDPAYSDAFVSYWREVFGR